MVPDGAAPVVQAGCETGWAVVNVYLISLLQSTREMQQLLLPELTWREYRSQERRGEVGKLIGYFSKIYTLYTSQQGRFNSQFILRLLLVGDQKYFSKLFFLFLQKKSLRKAWWSDKPVLWMMPSKAWWLNSYYIIKNIIKHTLYREFMQHFSVSELILI